jgi:formate-dependent nitrite reductase cytochrome c552 subunit
MQTQEKDRVLSPMFLTHVECTGCHIEQVAQKSGVLDSLGTVAKAVPRACDNCHKEGTGKQYVPFWQNKIKAMYEQVDNKLNKLKSRAQNNSSTQTRSRLNVSIGQAQSILDSISSDGSWGVHNFKYTEAMLLQADEIVSGAR